jgi:hypothetical protein
MKPGPLVLCALCALSFSTMGTAQAITQMVQITQGDLSSSDHPKQMSLPNTQSATQAGARGKKSSTAQSLADAPRSMPACSCSSQPIISIDSGLLGVGTQVTITSPSKDAAIFYTTDGWTPTSSSMRYTGPIAINADTRLQAIAQEPAKLPSLISQAMYKVTGSASVPENSLVIGTVISKGTSLRLVTGSEISSETAHVGGHILLLLDENLMAGETVLAPRGTSVDGTITRVERAGPAGKPGVLAFQATVLNVHGISVPISADLTLAARGNGAMIPGLSIDSGLRISPPLPDGNEVRIRPGMSLTAAVAADTPLHP